MPFFIKLKILKKKINKFKDKVQNSSKKILIAKVSKKTFKRKKQFPMSSWQAKFQ